MIAADDTKGAKNLINIFAPFQLIRLTRTAVNWNSENYFDPLSHIVGKRRVPASTFPSGQTVPNGNPSVDGSVHHFPMVNKVSRDKFQMERVFTLARRTLVVHLETSPGYVDFTNSIGNTRKPV